MARDFVCIVAVDKGAAVVPALAVAVGVSVGISTGLCVIDLIEFSDDECLSELLSVELIASIKVGVAADGSFDVV